MAELKVYIYSKGDYSVGIFSSYAEITIKDDLRYETKEEMIDLLQGLEGLWDGVAITELEQTQLNLKETEMAQELAQDILKEVEEKGNLSDTKMQVQMFKEERRYKKDIGNLKRKITKLKQSYRNQGIWFES